MRAQRDVWHTTPAQSAAPRRAAPCSAWSHGHAAVGEGGADWTVLYRRLVMYLYCFLLCECQHRQAPGSMRGRGAPRSPASLRGEALASGAGRRTLRVTSDEPATVVL